MNIGNRIVLVRSTVFAMLRIDATKCIRKTCSLGIFCHCGFLGCIVWVQTNSWFIIWYYHHRYHKTHRFRFSKLRIKMVIRYHVLFIVAGKYSALISGKSMLQFSLWDWSILVMLSLLALDNLYDVMEGKGDVLWTVIGCCSIDETFPKVKLFFDGGAVMNLGPTNYLIPVQLDVSLENPTFSLLHSSLHWPYSSHVVDFLMLKEDFVMKRLFVNLLVFWLTLMFPQIYHKTEAFLRKEFWQCTLE